MVAEEGYAPPRQLSKFSSIPIKMLTSSVQFLPGIILQIPIIISGVKLEHSPHRVCSGDYESATNTVRTTCFVCL